MAGMFAEAGIVRIYRYKKVVYIFNARLQQQLGRIKEK